MNKATFLKELKRELKHFPESERQDILTDYQEHFEFGLSEGRSEPDIAKELGHPNEISKDLYMTSTIDKAEQHHSLTNIARAVFATVSLSFFNLIIVFGPAIVLLSLYITLWCVAISFVVGAALLPLNTGIIGNSPVLTNIFTSLTLGGLGILVGAGMFYISNPLYRAAVSYIKWNVKIAKGV